MELANVIKMNKQPKNEDSAVDIEYCRLRHGLNINCQLEVFNYLSVNDLLQVSKSDTYFEELIMKWIIGNMLLNLELSHPSGEPEITKDLGKRMLRNNELVFETFGNDIEIFEAFGHSIRKLKVNASDYNLIPETITKYCTPAIMTEVHIKFSSSSKVKPVPMPIFTKLQRLRLESFSFNSELIVEHLKEIGVHSLDLKILHIIYKASG